MKDFEQIWHGIVKKMAPVYRLTANEEKLLKANRVAKLIAAIPYLAECRNPERSAIGNVSSYMIAKHSSLREVFDHIPADDKNIGCRLQGISRFEGGNQAVIDRGMNILYLTMVCNYQKDLQSDTELGKYNPIASGTWNYESLVHSLLADIAETPCPEMDKIFGAEEGTRGFWDPVAPGDSSSILQNFHVHDTITG